MSNKVILGLLLLLLLLAGTGWWFWQSSATPSSPGGSDTEQTTAAADAGATDEKDADDLPADTSPKPLDAPPQGQLPAVRDVGIDGQPAVADQEQAEQVLQQQKQALGLGQDSDLAIESNSDDGYGNQYYHLQQTYKGLPVFGARSVLEVEAGRAQVMSGTWVEPIEIDINPTYSAEQALRMALDQRGVPAQRKLTVLGQPSRLIFTSDQGLHLAWHLAASLDNPLEAPQLYVVDAHQPQILLQEGAMQR